MGAHLDKAEQKAKNMAKRIEDAEEQIAKLQAKPGNEKQVEQLQAKVAKWTAKLDSFDDED